MTFYRNNFRNFNNLVMLVLGLVFTTACEETYYPKEHGFPRMDLPEPAYVSYGDNHPFQFDVSKYAIAYNDTDRMAEPHWVNIKYPSLQAEVQLTYKNFHGDMKILNEHIEDARKLVNKHNIKAYGIEEIRIKTAQGQWAYLFALTGQVPTQFQFYTTDSLNNYLRGALYFQTATENDSLAPAIKYISNDMLRLVSTLKWKDAK